MDLIARRWLLVSAFVSASALAVAHAFERFGHLAPCELCLKAREVWWLALALALAGFVASLARPAFRRAAVAVLALVFLGGLALSIYHAGAEWTFWPGPASCSGRAPGTLHVTDLQRMLDTHAAAPSCEKPAWVFLGLSMAGWDGVLFAVMAFVSMGVARRARA